MACPHCDSDDWKLASLVYQSGLTHVDTSTTAVGVGFTDDGMDPGVGVGDTVGTHQTELSRLAAPPIGYRWTTALIKTCLFFAVLGWLFTEGLYLFAVISGGIALLLAPLEYRQHRNAMTTWERTRVCQCCGTFYFPCDSTTTT